MNLIFINEGPSWLLGIAWNSNAVVELLAWWMPLNLFLYLLILAWLSPDVTEFRSDATSLLRFFNSMFLTIPLILSIIALYFIDKIRR